MSLPQKKNKVPTDEGAVADPATSKSAPERAICFLLTMVAALCQVPGLNTKEWVQFYGKDTIRFVYVGIGGPTEDDEYFSNPLLHKEMPRGYIEVYINGRFVGVIHGCNKFFGEGDETSQGIDAKTKLPKVCVGNYTINQLSEPGVMVDITAKANGKFMTFSFFDVDGKTWVILSSKTTAVAFHLGGDAPSFIKNGGEENHILKGMYETFKRFWSEIPESARDALVAKSIKDHNTYLAEYEDGAHMVPLSGDNTLAITMVISCSQTGKPSESEMLHLVDGVHFTDWLKKIGVPANFIIQHLLVSIEEWFDKYSNEYSNINFFKAGKLIEGYVVRFISFDGKIMALMKSKTWEYIIKRSMREILRGLIKAFKKDKKPITPADASSRLRKKLTGPKAYPQGLSRSAVDACCQLASDFVKFCLKLNAERGIPMDNFVNFGGANGATDASHPNGMAESWEMFLQHNGGHGLPEALALIDDPSDASSATAADDVPTQPKYVPNMGAVKAINDFILSCVPGIRKFKLGDVCVTAFSYGRQAASDGSQAASNIAPLIIFQAISGTGKSTLCELLAELMNGVIGCADDYFKENCGGKFIPKLLGKAHEFCRNKVFGALLNRPVFACNTNCYFPDAFKYILEAIRTGRPIVILRMEPNGAFEDFAHKLAARGEHVSDIAILAKQWKIMSDPSNYPPTTYDELIKSQTTDAKKSSSDVKPPARSRGRPTPYTALAVDLPPAFRDMFPGTKDETHTTLKYGEHSSALLKNKTLRALELKLIEVREYIDPENPANFIACVVVSSPVLEELQTAGLVQDHLHITLRFGGTFKAMDSRKLLDGSLQPTRIIPVPEELSTVVASVAAM